MSRFFLQDLAGVTATAVPRSQIIDSFVPVCMGIKNAAFAASYHAAERFLTLQIYGFFGKVKGKGEKKAGCKVATRGCRQRKAVVVER